MGNNLRTIRKNRKITLKDISDAIGISVQSLSHYENNRRNPSSQIILELANFFNLDVKSIFPEINEDKVFKDPEEMESFNNMIYGGTAKVLVYSKIHSMNFDTIGSFVVGADSISNLMAQSGYFFGFLLENNDYLPEFQKGDVLIFNDLKSHKDKAIDLVESDDFIIVIDKNGNNTLMRVSLNEKFYFTDLKTKVVYNENQFDSFKFLGVLYQVNRRYKKLSHFNVLG